MRTTTIVIVVMAAVVGLSAVQPAAADWTQEAKITATDAAAGDYLGYSVSISGGYAVVGAYRDDNAGGDNAGSAYIYKRNGTAWTQQAKLTASDAADDDYFGHSVSISDDYAVVGASNNDDGGSNSGSAYIYKRDGTTWTEQAKLTASNAAASDNFGCSVSISGDYVVVGARYKKGVGNASGAAYIYKRDGINWTEQANLIASGAAAYDYFGWSVSISGNSVIVGAKYDDNTSGDDAGSAYIYKRDGTTWSQQARLAASDAAASDWFGQSVSISGDSAVVGAYGNDDAGNYSGSAYIFEKPVSGWAYMTETAKLTATDAEGGDYFGYSVSISGDSIVVGAYGDDHASLYSGSAYIFEKPVSGWVNMTETDKLTASDAAFDDNFGFSVSIDDGYALVGAYGDDDGGSISGSAYIYTPEPATASLLLLGAVVMLRRRRRP